jgi:predicted RNA binding protein YcfA (HicA-like mRNA interferase family)
LPASWSETAAGSCAYSGSHHIYGKPGSVVGLSIPIHGNRPLKTGLLRHLLKLAQIPENQVD